VCYSIYYCMSGNIKFINNKNEKIQLPSKGEWGKYFSRDKTAGKDNALLKFADSFVEERTKDVMEKEFPDLANDIIKNKDSVVKLNTKLLVQQEAADDKNCSVYTISRKPEINPNVLNEEQVSKIITENDALKQENEILKAKDRVLAESYKRERNAYNESLTNPSNSQKEGLSSTSQNEIDHIVANNTYLNKENEALRERIRAYEQHEPKKQTGEASTSTEEPEEPETISKVITPPPVKVSDVPRTFTKEDRRQLLKAQEEYKLLFTTLYGNEEPIDSTISGMSLREIQSEIEKLKNEARMKILDRAIAYDTSVNSNNFKERHSSETRVVRENKLVETVSSLVERYKLAFPKSSVMTPKFGGKSRRRSKRRSCTRKKTKTPNYRRRSLIRRRK
jgi:hypothetical protein